MVAFVLQHTLDIRQNGVNFISCHRYASFLKQFLQLWMFVPCDENGNVLEFPDPIHTYGLEPADYEYSDEDVEKYQKAKDRVLFEGFEVCNRLESVKCVVNGDLHFSYDHAIAKKETIEDLVKYQLTLTASAIKQISE